MASHLHFSHYLFARRVEVIVSGVKAAMTCVSVFLFGLPKWMSVIQSFLTLFMLYTYVKWEPCTGKIINMIRSGGFASIFYTVRSP